MIKYTKCDFCQYSINKNGKLVCQFGTDGCAMTQNKIMEILKLIITTNEKENKK